MDRLNVIEDPETSVVINELSALTINQTQVGLNQFDEKLEDISSDDGNEDPLGNKYRLLVAKIYNIYKKFFLVRIFNNMT